MMQNNMEELLYVISVGGHEHHAVVCPNKGLHF